MNALPFLVTLRAVMMANVLNSFLPSKSGDLAKAFYLKQQVGLTRGLGTVVLERMVDLSVLGALGLVGFFISGEKWGLVAGLLLLGGMSVLFFSIMYLPMNRLPLPGKLKSAAVDFRSVWHNWFGNITAMLQTVLASCGVWSIGGCIVFLLARGLGQPIAIAIAYGIFPLAVLAGLLPTTISGIGTRDAAFMALLSAHMPTEEATLIGFGYTIIAYWMLSLISLPVVYWEIVRFYRKRET